MSGIPHPRRVIAIAVVLGIVAFGAFALAAYVLATSHAAACHSRDTILDVDAYILDSTKPTPAEAEQLTPQNAQRLHDFYVNAYTKIDEARC